MRINNYLFQNFSNQFSICSERIHNSFSKVSSVFLRHAPSFFASPQLKKRSEPILQSHQERSERMNTSSPHQSILKTKHTRSNRKKVQFKNTALDSLSTSSILDKKCAHCFHLVFNWIKGFLEKEKPIICPILRAEELKSEEIRYDGSSIMNTTQKERHNPNSLFFPLLNRDIVSTHTTSSVIQIRDHWGV